MQPSFKTIPEKKLLGKKRIMSFADNRTAALWQSFMPQKKDIDNIADSNLYSLEIYEPDFFYPFDPTKTFEKWAAVEVTDYDQIPAGMEALHLPAGLYAVFPYKGLASEAGKTYRYIFTEWLPVSGFALDDRPHFALMGEKYKRDDKDSEEEIWIPVKPNSQ